MQHRDKLVDSLLNAIDNVMLVVIALWIFIWWTFQPAPDEQPVKKD